MTFACKFPQGAGFFCICLLFSSPPAAPIHAQEVLRGEVRLDLEQVYDFYMEAPINLAEARRRAAQEAALFYGAMIYGWSFHYDVGEKARGIAENLQLSPLGSAFPEELEVTDTQIKDTSLYLWSDYRLDDAQKKRLSMWKKGTTRSAQGLGYGPMGITPLPRADGIPGPANTLNSGGEEAWLSVKRTALEDAARAAIRAVLRGQERNRPKEVSGFISLAAFPHFWLHKGQWAASGRFLVNIMEIIPFAAY